MLIYIYISACLKYNTKNILCYSKITITLIKCIVFGPNYLFSHTSIQIFRANFGPGLQRSIHAKIHVSKEEFSKLTAQPSDNQKPGLNKFLLDNMDFNMDFLINWK